MSGTATSAAVFVRDGQRFRATELARGPWDPGALHGGAPAALLMRAFEELPSDPELMLCRVTYELLRPVPLGGLEVSAEVIRPGRRVQLLEGSLRTTDGAEVVRARALRVRRAEASAPVQEALALPGPDRGRSNYLGPPGAHRPMFAVDTMDIRFLEGAFLEPGPATAWFRLRYPLVAGEETSPLQRLAAAGDFGNGISAVLTWEDHVFINPDLTMYVERVPVGEWICLRSETRINPDGVAISESVLYDQGGRVGHAIQALVVGRR